MIADYETLWNAIPHPALALDGDAKVIAFNVAAEQFFSVSARSMRGRSFSEFTPSGSRLEALIAQARDTGSSLVERGVEMNWADEAAQLVDVQVSPIAPESVALLVLLQPRSIAEKMNRSLAHRGAVRSVTGMAATLAHEIRNPLAAISGAAQLMQMSVSDQEGELAELIQEEADRIHRLVGRMEHFTDARPPERAPVNVHDALQMTRRAAQAGFAANIKFIEEYDPSLPQTPGDRDQLAQAFQNLVKNAAEAVGEGGSITLRTAYRPGVRLADVDGARQSLPLEVSVSDTGPGIPDDLAQYVFEPFVTSKSGGTGLGLALVSKIVADHGGVIEYDRVAGRTTFRMLLPVWREGQ